MNLDYRKEIDGLRGIAIILVIFFHANFKFFKGGFIGVDIFFVISGYLITTIIIKDLIHNKFSIKFFYERRARRILPALFFVMLTTIPAAWIFLSRSELSDYLKSVIATTFFSSNFFFYKTIPYFSFESEFKPLIHTWSLSIEEQFYIFFPFFLIFIWKIKKECLLYFFIIIFTISLLILKYTSTYIPKLNFYFTLSRVWELVIGAIVAYYTINKKFFFSKFLNNIFSLIGFLMIIISIHLFRNQFSYPSLYTLIPVVGTALIIFFGNYNTFVGKFLSLKILVGIGLISYSLYLWHQPVFAFTKNYFENINFEFKLFLIFICFLLAFLSWRFIEKPFRDALIISKKKLLFLIIFFIFFFSIFSFLTFNYFDSNSKGGSENELAKLLSYNKGIFAKKMDERIFIKYRVINESYKPKILVVGSSRIMQLSEDETKETTLNFSVSGASLEDHVVITEMALEKFKPSTVYLGADPWLFNLYNNQTRWKSLRPEYEKALSNIYSWSNKKNSEYIEKKKLINLHEKNLHLTFREKILEKIYSSVNLVKYYDLPKDFENNTKDIIRKDGRRIPKKNSDKIKVEIVNYSIEKYLFSNQQFEIYENFLKHLLFYHKKDVILVLSPFYGPSYEISEKQKMMYIEIEKNFIDLAKKYKIRIVGSYDPKKNNCELGEFYDAIHPKPSCMFKIISE